VTATSATRPLPHELIESAFPTRPWLDPEATSSQRLPMRPLAVPCPDASTARALDGAAPSTFAGSPWWLDLDGEWELTYDPTGGAAAGRRRNDPVRTEVVEVPWSWTMQGFGAPHYTNVVMPFDAEPPAVPEVNPMGVYRRTVTVPQDWTGRRVVLRVGGAESWHAVFVDGKPVGYGSDSRLPSEYDLTSFVRPGRRVELAIVVVKWSAQTWVEDQDQWWHGGLQRSVAVYSTADSHLSELALVPGLVEPAATATTGALDATVTVRGPAVRAPGWTVEVAVESMGGRRHATTGRLAVPAWAGDSEAAQLVSGMYVRPGVVAARLEVPRIRPWSHETPQRYRALVTLRDATGTVVEVTAVRTGFRSVEVRDRALLVNGAPVVVHGVNHHEHDPERGRAVTPERTRADLLSMKAHHLNAVRASHAPHDEHFAELCDELGLYVVDEANVESHARQASLVHHPRYARTMVERADRMARRDLHHPSVIVWSLGNEAGDGPPHDAAAALLRRLDPSRPVQYEGPFMHDLHAEAACSDIVCPMYPELATAVERAAWHGDQRRPVILCEYSHAMGNSNGSLAEHVEAFWSVPGLQGGFIWEWLEHGIALRDADGTPRLGPDGSPCWGYGGDFGDVPNDGNFICDGLVSADRVPHPAMAEVRHLGRPLTAELVGRGRVRVTNRRWFTDTSDLRAEWEVAVDGRVVASDAVAPTPIAPQSATVLQVPTTVASAVDGAPVSGSEAFLTVRWRRRRATPWSPAGTVVAEDQLPLPLPRARRARAEPVVADAGDPGAGGGLGVSFRPTVFRALTDNDAIQVGWMAEWSPRLAGWLPLVDGLPDGVTADVSLRVDDAARSWWRLDAVITLDDRHADVPRVGVVAELPAAWTDLEWFGDGPHESYPDRRSSVRVGRWRATVADQYVPYAFPQEHGHHTGLRWLRLRDPDSGDGIEVVAAPVDALGFAVRHHTDAELFAARHVDELTPLDAPTITVLHLDAAQRGLGTGSCGPDALAPYRIGAGEHRISVRLRRTVRRP
jgi:beta-galactosidase